MTDRCPHCNKPATNIITLKPWPEIVVAQCQCGKFRAIIDAPKMVMSIPLLQRFRLGLVQGDL